MLAGARFSWFAACIAAVSCSAILPFNPDGQPCNTQDRLSCLSGYSCLIKDPSIAANLQDANAIDQAETACVIDHSIKQGDACLLDRQCEENLICPTEFGQCARPCALSQAFVPATGCRAGEYCKLFNSIAMYSDVQPHTSQQVAACVASDGCTSGGTCSTPTVAGGGVCAPMGNLAQACVVGCEITFSGGAYQDNCGSGTANSLSFCQPLPVIDSGADDQVLACLPINANVQAAGGACGNAVASSCQKGLGCINGICAAYCNLSATTGSSCAAGFTCCDLHLSANQLVGYCNSKATCD